jgi:hypothetical protein
VILSFSQVHEIHPSHAFLVVTDKPARSRSEPDMHPPLLVDHGSEQCESGFQWSGPFTEALY